mmetsp:Transcript_45472/g.102979  ORF Transcript_45472/g.102979 Transcript_45472/m.102979 type:complete len:145 (-) Transcript_45472:412-846(-)
MPGSCAVLEQVWKTLSAKAGSQRVLAAFCTTLVSRCQSCVTAGAPWKLCVKLDTLGLSCVRLDFVHVVVAGLEPCCKIFVHVVSRSVTCVGWGILWATCSRLPKTKTLCLLRNGESGVSRRGGSVSSDLVSRKWSLQSLGRGKQ